MIRKPPIATIGSKELVDFPRLRLENIPAKVDTGADSSSIWVSQVRPVKDGLSFVLFGPDSKFYTGEKITVKSFETAIVKSSSGIPEFRYKVRLVVKLQNRRIRAWFTLSDRSGMNFPVLLGRRFLKNKFMVDVGKPITSKKGKNAFKKVLILISKPRNLDELNTFYKKLFGSKSEITVRSYRDLAFWISSGKVEVKDSITGQSLDDFDLVFFKSHKNSSELAGALAQYLQDRRIDFIDRELLSAIAYDKLSVYVRLALKGVDVPSIFCGPLDEIKNRYSELSKLFGKAMVVKEINADRGKKNYFIRNKKDLEALISKSSSGEIYLAQKYIENDGYIRAYVFGKNVSPIIHRTPVNNPDRLKQHLNQPSGSANAVLLDDKSPDLKEVKRLAVRVSELMNRQVAGVDIIKDKKTGKYFVLEVNQGSQLKSGSFTKEKLQALVKFIDNELNR